MTRKILAICLIAVLMLSLFAGCKSNGVLDQEDAKKIVLEDLGVKEKDVKMDVHTTTVDGAVCWSVYVTVNGQQLQYVIHGVTGEILSSGESDHHH